MTGLETISINLLLYQLSNTFSTNITNDDEEVAYEEVRVDRTDSDFDLQLKMYQ